MASNHVLYYRECIKKIKEDKQKELNKMNNPNKNNNCDNDKCTNPNSEVRVLPTGGDSNGILCRACFFWEMEFRNSRNHELSEDCKFKIPKWESLKIYNPGA